MFNIGENLKSLEKAFKSENFQIRIVGGAVRDFIAGVEPKDYDLCTDATPDEMISIAEKNNFKIIPTGISHGTMTFVINNELYEVTTLREDLETDGRHATVQFTRNFETDATRRDLTINAMSMDFDGTLHDYFNGKEDLLTGNIKFVGDAKVRVQEDFLRLFRFFRFLAKQEVVPGSEQYDNVLAPVDKFVSESWVKEGIDKLSGERIWSELNKIIGTKYDVSIINEMGKLGLFETIAPSLNATAFNNSSLFSLSHRKEPKYTEFFKMYGLYSLVRNLHPSDISKFVDRLKISVSERKIVEALVSYESFVTIIFKNHSTLYLPHSVLSTEALICWFKNEGYSTPLALMLVFILNYSVPFYNPHLTNTWVSNLFLTFESFINSKGDFVPANTVKFEISGSDLIALGMKPGPNIGKTITFLKHIWLANDCKISKEKMLDMISNFDLNSVAFTSCDIDTEICDNVKKQQDLVMVRNFFNETVTQNKLNFSVMFKNEKIATKFKLALVN
jgi:tRNA nucleotidyltransferase/poly(A) polymerase